MADELSYDADEMLRAVCRIFEALNVPPDEALCVADCLIWANLRGIDSHGVIRIPSYVRRVEDGITNPKPKMEVVKDTLAGMIIDGDHGFGPIALTFAMDKAIEKARHASIGWVLVKNSSHAGAVGYYTRRAAKVGMAGLFMGASQPNMAYHGAKVAGVATNPIAISVPGRKHEVIALDMATAVAGVGKLMMHRDTGETLGPGWALDANGQPTTDPQKAHLPTPLGGPKGSGMSLMFECLTSLMVGAPLVERFINGTYTSHQQNGLVVAIDIAAFTDPDTYRADVDKLVDAIKGLPAADGVDEILVPGERSDAVFLQRSRTGIPVPANTWQRIENVAADLGVKLPSPM
jgi:LDH2 family malate/lactate/ureidoglycolate dehydrogenase